MGKGGRDHEFVIDYLEERYGGGREVSYCSIYPEWWKEVYRKERPLKIDFVSEKALVEVSHKDEWRQQLGKVISLLYEVEHNDSFRDKDIWIIFPFGEPQTKFQRGLDGEKYCDYWRDWVKRLKEIVLYALRGEYKDKIKFYLFDLRSNRQELIPII